MLGRSGLRATPTPRQERRCIPAGFGSAVPVDRCDRGIAKPGHAAGGRCARFRCQAKRLFGTAI